MQYRICAQEGSVSLRPLESQDSPLLLHWLTDSRNLAYWEGESAVFTPERIQEDFYHDEWNASRCIIQYEGRDIGYAQAYLLDGEMFAEYQYPRTDLRTFGIDQFISDGARASAGGSSGCPAAGFGTVAAPRPWC